VRLGQTRLIVFDSKSCKGVCGGEHRPGDNWANESRMNGELQIDAKWKGRLDRGFTYDGGSTQPQTHSCAGETLNTWERCRPLLPPHAQTSLTLTFSHPTFASLMPSERSVSTQPQPEDLDLSRDQIKVCIVCKAPVSSADVDYSAHLLLIEPDIPLLCAGCRETRSTPARQQYPISTGGRGSFGGAELVRPVLQALQAPPDGPTPIPFPTSQSHPSTSPPDVPELSRSVSASSESNAYLPRVSDKIHHAPKVKIHTDNAYPISRTASSESSQSQKEVRHESIHSPNPLVDITKLRVRSPTHHCLYPGATFTGTQKSGRSSYDVNVTIVVRPSSSSWSSG
jgi:hypothetical protein